METHRATAILALTMGLTWGAAPKGLSPSIVLRVLNEACVEPRKMARAEKEAAAILGRARIELVFLNCEAGRAAWGRGNPCQCERGPAEFWFRVVVNKPKTTTEEMLGFTELEEASGSGLAGVYYPAAVETANQYGTEVSQMLGAAIAHEVGHLILGAHAHTRRGLMSPRWGPAQFEQISISELSFTPDQWKLLQNEVRSRASSPIQDRPIY